MNSRISMLLLLLFSQLSCMNQFEKENNNLLAETLNILDLSDKKVSLERIEQKYLYNIEQDVKQQVASLPCNLKKLLGDFDTKFKQFKDKLAFLKKNENLLVDDFLDSTILGLKPVTIINNDEPELMDLKRKLISKVESTYKGEYLSGTLKQELIDNNIYELIPEEQILYMMCCNPVFPLAFIKECYKDSLEPKNFLTEFNSILLSKNESKVKKFLEIEWNSYLQSTDDAINKVYDDKLAYILGYTPIVFGKSREKEVVSVDEISTVRFCKYIKDENPSIFRNLLVLGETDPQDRSPYLLLLAKLYEYDTVVLVGLDGYLGYLDSRIKFNLPTQCRAPLDVEDNDKFFYIRQIISKLAEPKHN